MGENLPLWLEAPSGRLRFHAARTPDVSSGACGIPHEETSIPPPPPVCFSPLVRSQAVAPPPSPPPRLNLWTNVLTRSSKTSITAFVTCTGMSSPPRSPPSPSHGVLQGINHGIITCSSPFSSLHQATTPCFEASITALSRVVLLPLPPPPPATCQPQCLKLPRAKNRALTMVVLDVDLQKQRYCEENCAV